jgi:hypothetical protein
MGQIGESGRKRGEEENDDGSLMGLIVIQSKRFLISKLNSTMFNIQNGVDWEGQCRDLTLVFSLIKKTNKETDK